MEQCPCCSSMFLHVYCHFVPNADSAGSRGLVVSGSKQESKQASNKQPTLLSIIRALWLPRLALSSSTLEPAMVKATWRSGMPKQQPNLPWFAKRGESESQRAWLTLAACLCILGHACQLRFPRVRRFSGYLPLKRRASNQFMRNVPSSPKESGVDSRPFRAESKSNSKKKKPGKSKTKRSSSRILDEG